MARRKYEKTQPRNPHGLTIRQHVFPCKSIARFTNNTGVVNLHHLSIDKVRIAKPSDDIFCARRGWDQGAESGYMKQMEDKFQATALRIIEGKVTKIETTDKLILNQFFALWKWRAIYRDKEMIDVKFNGITGGKYTKDEEEAYERMGILICREGGVMPAHRVHGFEIQMGIMHDMSALPDVEWVIVRAQEGQFIVPDFPVTPFIPLEPTLCLCGTRGNVIANVVIRKSNVIDINRNLIANSKKYYFANDLQECF